MTTQPVREAVRRLDHRWQSAVAALGDRFSAFRETRLYVQTVLMVVMLAVAGLAVLLPFGPLGEVRRAVEWVVTHDYDFRGQVLTLNRRVQDRGGWVKATGGLWAAGVAQVRAWAPLPAAPLPAQRLAPLLPVDGSVLTAYGWSSSSGADRLHEGLDVMANAGTPVVAIGDGTVLSADTDPALGQYVDIDHGSVLVRYAQVDGIRVSSGQVIRRGQVLAAVARSVGSEAALPAHLHLEVHTKPGGIPIDPASYLGLGGKKL